MSTYYALGSVLGGCIIAVNNKRQNFQKKKKREKERQNFLFSWSFYSSSREERNSKQITR